MNQQPRKRERKRRKSGGEKAKPSQPETDHNNNQGIKTKRNMFAVNNRS